MRCPACNAVDSRVVDSRIAEEGTATRRRRRCSSCDHRFTTYERVDHAPLTVLKSTGTTEAFDRSKVVSGLSAATKGRGVDADDLEAMATRVEDSLRMAGDEVSSAAIGLAVLDELRVVDDVSYLRFASVYKHFDAAADFHRELELMEKMAPAGGASG
ncbi:transcriptional regulator NrdR [Ilumatobacter sp.]|uniref:transcriptional regulator NrdR n=1 Tax=Ilumatobacter sp. TaxID=1967498 RepID=UPI003B526754